MKSAHDVLRYIDDWYANCLERPRLFALNAHELESVLATFEEIREFILSDAGREETDDFGYGAFLRETKDVGSLGYVLMRRQLDGVSDENKLFDEMVCVWREYLTSNYRRPYP
jgi:hypothetical protein